MKANGNFLILLITITGSVNLFFTGCYSQSIITSGYVPDTIAVDGLQNEWGKSLKFVEDSKMSVGFTNSNKYLYFTLITSDKANINKILTLGLTLWLEPVNGKKIGVRFPQKIEMKPGDRMLAEQGINNEPNEDGFRNRINEMINRQNEISILNENEYSLFLFDKTNENGFDGEIGFAKGQFVYELKIPLEGNSLSPITFSAKPGDEIGIEIVSGEFKRLEMKGGTPPMGEQQPGMRGGNPGGGMGRPGGRRGMADLTKKIDYSARVVLAKNQ